MNNLTQFFEALDDEDFGGDDVSEFEAPERPLLEIKQYLEFFARTVGKSLPIFKEFTVRFSKMTIDFPLEYDEKIELFGTVTFKKYPTGTYPFDTDGKLCRLVITLLCGTYNDLQITIRLDNKTKLVIESPSDSIIFFRYPDPVSQKITKINKYYELIKSLARIGMGIHVLKGTPPLYFPVKGRKQPSAPIPEEYKILHITGE